MENIYINGYNVAIDSEDKEVVISFMLTHPNMMLILKRSQLKQRLFQI